MKKLTLFLSAMLLACATFATEAVCYTLTPASGKNNSYAGSCDITINNITWNLTGNSQTNPWRIGGKSLTKVDRTLYSKTALNQNVTKIEVTHGSASGIKVNSFTLLVAGKADFTDAKSYTGTFAANSTSTFTRPDGADWNNKYYKFVYNVTNSTGDNKYIQFKEAKFYIAAGISATAIEVAPTTLDLVIGEKSTLSATLTPANATDVVEWTTDAESVATVKNGVVTAVGEGTATITATAGSVSATCTVTVSAIPATGISLDQTSLTLKQYATETLTATITPENTTDKLTWSSSDVKVATVTDGVVKGIAPGVATITATVGAFSATCEVTVEAPLSYAVATDAAALAVGDVIVLGCKAKNTVAGAMGKETYFASKTAAIDTDGNLTSGDAIEITLGGYPGAWMLQTEEGFVGCYADKKLSISGSRDSVWTIAIDSKDSTATIKNHTDSYGTMKFNSQNPRFTTYASGQTAIEIYVKPTTTPMYVVTVETNNAEYGSVLGGGNYREGTTAVLTAVPAEGYKFTGWSNNSELTNATQTFPVTESVTITANFAKGETAITNTTLNAKTIKTIENGQLIIIRDGKKYNAMGVRL